MSSSYPLGFAARRAYLRSRVIYTVAAPDIESDRGPLPLDMAEPNPSPWSPPVFFLISVISQKEVIAKLPEGQLRDYLGKRADHAISRFIEDYSEDPRPNPEDPLKPWHPHGPPPVYSIVSELAMAANSFPEGRFRNELLEVAARITQRAFGSAGAGKLHQE